jgi:dihydroorotate dehydrogenase (NAD+) catalytic subunit
VVCGTDVAEFMLAGATAVQVGTASFVRDPRKILGEFTSYLKEDALNAAELTGALRGVRPALRGGGDI